MPLDDTTPPPAEAGPPPSIADQIATARKAGYSDQDIASYLRQSKTWAPRFDAARQAGYGDDEVYSHLGLKLEPTAAPAPETDQPGFFGTLARSAVRGAVESSIDVAHAATPFRDRAQTQQAPDAVEAELQKSFLNGGWHDPNWWAANIGHGLGSSAPGLALGAAGAGAGAVIGSEVPVVGNLTGAAIGGAAGFGLGSALQTLAPAYQRARSEGLSHDAAVDRAMVDSGIAGAFGAAAGVLPGVSAFGRTASGALKRPISEALAQVFGAQPAVGVAQTAATAAAEGRAPTADELAAAYASQAGAGAALTAGHALLPQGAAAPTSGQPAAEAAAAQPATGARVPTPPEPPAPDIPPLPPGARPLATLEAMAAQARPPAAAPGAPPPGPVQPPPPPEPARATPEAKPQAVPAALDPDAPAPPDVLRPTPFRDGLGGMLPGGAITRDPAVWARWLQEDAGNAAPPPHAEAPARIRTVQQIMDQDGVGAAKAKATQEAEIAAVGRPITEEERQARAAGVASTPPSAQNIAPTQQARPAPDAGAPLYPTIPKEPTRLTQFLRSIGGVQDPGGDVRSTLGGAKYRPGLISRDGRTLDDAALIAWENGYFPQHGEERPTINDLLEAIDDDVRGRPVYSHNDIDAADAYNAAIERNGEVDRLAAQYGIETAGRTRQQFFDEVARSRGDDATAEMERQAVAHQDAYRQMETEARQWADENGERFHAGDFYGGSQTRSLEDLEREDQQENAAAAEAERTRGLAQPVSPVAAALAGEAGGGPRGGGAGAAESIAKEGLAQRINAVGQRDIFGGETQPAARREAEPTIRTDRRQETLPGMEPSAVQAQAARDQAGPRGGQMPADQGLFARRETPQAPLPLTAARESRWKANFYRDEMATVPHYTPEQAHAAAADWVVRRGIETGKEHLAAVHNATGDVVQAVTGGQSDFVPFQHSFVSDERDAYTIHHNHPRSYPMSADDLRMLANPGISHIVAHAHDGNTYVASAGPAISHLRSANALDTIATTIQRSYNRASVLIKEALTPMARAGLMSYDQANRNFYDMVARVLHANGLIDYATTRIISPDLERIVAGAAKELNGAVSGNRIPESIRPDQRTASLPRPDGAQRSGEGPASASRGGQGAGLPPGARQDRLLEASHQRDAVEAADFAALREEADHLAPTSREDERRLGPVRAAVGGIMDRARDVGVAVQTMLAPLSTGSKRAQAFAADFANAMRQVAYRYGTIDRELERNFTPKQREAMARAMDAQSVFEQQARDLPVAEQETARAAFEAGRTGISALPLDQQRALHLLDRLSQDVWRRMQERGMVAPNARSIPWYFARQILMHDPENGFARAGGAGAGGNRALEPIGRNLTTAGPMRREHLTPEETEMAAKAALGRNAVLLRDIRSLVNRLQQNERAIGGVDLMNKIDEVGKSTGVDMVIRGDIPGTVQPGDYFTIADHPSFRQWTGNGWRAIHVAREFEGPLNAVLSRQPGAWYRGAMSAKGGVMSAIMYSPFIHLAVELGRALPVMPYRVLSLQALRDGSRLRRDLGYMDAATRDGLAPLGHRWAADPTTIADQANPEQRGRFAQMFGNVRDAVANAAGRVGGDFLHDVIQHPHQALLWDQVFNLQVGIYEHLRSKWIAQGFDPQVAGTAAAHMANRYAGALPAENLSKGANMAANLLLFSRSFTLGNLGVMKDMLTGAPSHVLARLEQIGGAEQAKGIQSALRRKAISAFVLDVGLFYMANALAQAGIQAMRQGVGPTLDQWGQRATEALDETANGNPLAIFGVLPQHWNEPGRENRIYAGTDDEGRGIYLRLPAGKVGEEFVGWMSKPGVMVENKMSPLVRPIIEMIIGRDSLGRELLPPHPQTIGDYIDTAGAVAQHIAESLGPMSTIQGLADIGRTQVLGEKTQGDRGVALAKVLGPLTGLAQVSSGRPGGPVAGEMAAQAEMQRYWVSQAMPSIRRKIINGDTSGAVADMTALGIAPGLQRYYVTQTLHPQPTRRQMQDFQRTATPEERARVGLQ